MIKSRAHNNFLKLLVFHTPPIRTGGLGFQLHTHTLKAKHIQILEDFKKELFTLVSLKQRQLSFLKYVYLSIREWLK